MRFSKTSNLSILLFWKIYYYYYYYFYFDISFFFIEIQYHSRAFKRKTEFQQNIVLCFKK